MESLRNNQKREKIALGYEIVPFRDNFYVITCPKCLEIGHSKGNCASELCCGTCGDKHPTKDCKRPENPETNSFILCKYQRAPDIRRKAV